MTEELTWSTEQRNPASLDLDTRPVADVVDVILEQDASVADAVRACSQQVAAASEMFLRVIRAGGTIHYVGSGTSGRIAVLDAVELLPTYGVGDDVFRAHLAGGAGAMTKAVEGAEDDAEAGAEIARQAEGSDVIVGIAASGRTPYVRGALQAARDRGLPTVLIAANPQAPLAPLADIAILVDTGPEVITGSTRMKAATAQKMILNALSTATMIKWGKTYSNLMICMLPTNDKLRKRSVRMLAQGSGCPEPACAAMLAASDGDVRTALVALLSERDVAEARAALRRADASPNSADPAGIRTAVGFLR